MVDIEGSPAAWPMLVWTGAAMELPVSIRKTDTMLSETVSCEKPVSIKIKEFRLFIRENFHGYKLKIGFHWLPYN